MYTLDIQIHSADMPQVVAYYRLIIDSFLCRDIGLSLELCVSWMRNTTRSAAKTGDEKNESAMGIAYSFHAGTINYNIWKKAFGFYVNRPSSVEVDVGEPAITAMQAAATASLAKIDAAESVSLDSVPKDSARDSYVFVKCSGQDLPSITVSGDASVFEKATPLILLEDPLCSISIRIHPLCYIKYIHNPAYMRRA